MTSSGQRVTPWIAFKTIEAGDVLAVDEHPAVDRLQLLDGTVVEHWHGNDEQDCEWRVVGIGEPLAPGRFRDALIEPVRDAFAMAARFRGTKLIRTSCDLLVRDWGRDVA